MQDITPKEVDELQSNLLPLVGVRIKLLQIPRGLLKCFEPSQVGTIVGTLVDACVPELHQLLEDNTALAKVGLEKHEGILGDREGYPDFKHESGKRVELKLLYVEPTSVEMKQPATPREASARLTQKVTVKNVNRSTDVLLVLAYQLQPGPDEPDMFSPVVTDVGVFSMIDCIRARDQRLTDGGGKWFGDYETPAVLSKMGKAKLAKGEPLDHGVYGRKESEGRDYNEDTNFGKLKRIPCEPLQRFLKKHGATYARRGHYPKPWVISD